MYRSWGTEPRLKKDIISRGQERAPDALAQRTEWSSWLVSTGCPRMTVQSGQGRANPTNGNLARWE